MARSPEEVDSSPVHGRPESATGATRLAFDRIGKGEPMVLLHGQGFSRRSWDPVIDALSDHHDVIAVDLPGHGDSPRQPDGRGSAPRDLAVAVTELLDELGLDRPHVVGHSSGGWVALELGRLHRAGTVTGLAPAGLWRSAPPHLRLAMRQFGSTVDGWAIGSAVNAVQSVRAGASKAPVKSRGVVFGRRSGDLL